MDDQLFIAEAGQNFAAIVRKLDRSPYVEIIQWGKSVAILISIQEPQHLTSKRVDFWQSYLDFRDTVDLENWYINPSLFEGLRVVEPGRGVDL